MATGESAHQTHQEIEASVHEKRLRAGLIARAKCDILWRNSPLTLADIERYRALQVRFCEEMNALFALRNAQCEIDRGGAG